MKTAPTKGFTLIEVLVSLAIASVALSVLLQLYVTLGRSEYKTQQYFLKLIDFQNYFIADNYNQAPSQEENTYHKSINTIHSAGHFVKYSIQANDDNALTVNVFQPKT